MSDFRDRLDVLVILAVLCGVNGCSQILGVDEYRVASRGPTAPTRDTGTLFDPKPPYLTGKTCEACIAANCASQEAACDADEACSAWLADARAHPEPPAVHERSVQIGSVLWAKANAMGGDYSVTIPATDLRKCAIDQCTRDCELGRDFSCVGDFEWSRTFPTETVLSVRWSNYLNRQPIVGALMRACAAGQLTCSDSVALGGGTTALDGSLTFSVLNPTVGRYPEFDGMLVLENASGFPPMLTQSSRPLLSGEHAVYAVVPEAILDPEFTSLGVSIGSPGSALGQLQPFDCRGMPAKGVMLDVLLLENGVYEPCSFSPDAGPGSCAVIYSNDQGLPDQAAKGFTSLGQIAFFQVPIGKPLLFALRDMNTHIAVGIHPFSVFNDHYNYQSFYPSSQQQVESYFPPNERVRSVDASH